MSAIGTLSSSQLDGEANAVVARSVTPVCFVVDDDARIRHFLSLILQGAGVDAVELASATALRADRLPRDAHLIFLDISADTDVTIQLLEALGKARYAGAVQLMGNQGYLALESFKRIGSQYRLRMLPVLKKPFVADDIKKILQSEQLGDRPAVAARVRLDDALKSGWVETWYQPKINLAKKQLAGCEAFARVRHPDFGVLPPSAFMPGADEETLRSLAVNTLERSLKVGLELSKLGVKLRIAVNMTIDVLTKVPVEDIVKQYRPRPDDWVGLIVDVTEEQVVTHIDVASECARRLQECNVKLAIDDFGRGVSSLMKFKDVSIAEMKLDRAFVTDCSADKQNASICKSVVDLAHSFGSLAVGIGVERADDLAALVGMGCDLGQGFLLGQPMAEERFLALLKQRVATQTATQRIPTNSRSQK